MADKTILVVDYDEAFRSSLVDILNNAGYRAYGAPDGTRGIGIAGSLGGSGVNLLVLEMAQLDMTGVELIHTIACQQKSIIKVIASSSLFSQADMDIQSSFHADAGVRKDPTSMPAIASQWLLTVRSLLGELAEPALAPSSSVILVADDDPTVRHFVKVVLNREGYQVLEASSGESALALARKLAGAFDLVVTDIQMPGMDGRALGEAIRELASNVPVIYVSGQVENADLNKPDEGFVFIAKPFLPKTLLKAASLMLSRGRRPRP